MVQYTRMQKLMSIPQLLTEILGGGRIGPPLVVGRPKKVGGNRVKNGSELLRFENV